MDYQTPSYIYFIQSQVDDHRIKIGYTINLSFRFLSHRRGYKLPLVLLGVMDGGYEEEQALHKRFAGYQMRSEVRNSTIEWFQPAPELLTFIKENTYFPKFREQRPRRLAVDQERAIALESLAYTLEMTTEDLLAEAIDAVIAKNRNGGK